MLTYHSMDFCCSLRWRGRGALAARRQKSRHHRDRIPSECCPLLPKDKPPTMSSYGGQRRADDRRGTFTQKAANQVVEKSVDGGDDDEIRSRIAANLRAFRKNYEIAIPTRNLKWTNLARYLELEFREFGVQIPKDQKVRPSSGHVFLRPMAACRVRLRGEAGSAQLLIVVVLTESHRGKRAFRGDAPCPVNSSKCHRPNPAKLDANLRAFASAQAQKQDIDLLRGSQEEIEEFFQALEEEKQLGTVPEDSEV